MNGGAAVSCNRLTRGKRCQTGSGKPFLYQDHRGGCRTRCAPNRQIAIDSRRTDNDMARECHWALQLLTLSPSDATAARSNVEPPGG